MSVTTRSELDGSVSGSFDLGWLMFGFVLSLRVLR